MKYEYMKFVRIEGEYVLFKKANILDKLIVGTGISIFCRLLNIPEGVRLLIKVPKYIFEEIVNKKLKGE